VSKKNSALRAVEPHVESHTLEQRAANKRPVPDDDMTVLAQVIYPNESYVQLQGRPDWIVIHRTLQSELTNICVGKPSDYATGYLAAKEAKLGGKRRR
jgi:hypothetical protein